MRDCWDEFPTLRPDFSSIRSRFILINKGKYDTVLNGSGINGYVAWWSDIPITLFERFNCLFLATKQPIRTCINVVIRGTFTVVKLRGWWPGVWGGSLPPTASAESWKKIRGTSTPLSWWLPGSLRYNFWKLILKSMHLSAFWVPIGHKYIADPWFSKLKGTGLSPGPMMIASIWLPRLFCVADHYVLDYLSGKCSQA